MFKSIGAAAMAVAIMTATATAGETVLWSFDETTTGEDVFFDTPTAVNPDAPQYDATVEITLVEVDVLWNNVPFNNIDITDEIPPEDLMASETLAGPPPITVIEDQFVYPEPPEEPGFAATITVTIDEDGFGHGSLTDVTLGDVVVDIGFGPVTVTLTSVRVVGTVEVTPVFAPGDLDRNGVVNVFDLLDMLAVWGACADPCPPSCAADLNDDCTVNVFDLLELLANWG